MAIHLLAATIVMVADAKTSEHKKEEKNNKTKQVEGDESSDYPDLLNFAFQIYR